MKTVTKYALSTIMGSLAAIALVPQSHAAVLVAWTTDSETATVVTTGFTGTHTGRNSVGTGSTGSDDGTYGTLAGAPGAAPTGNGTSYVRDNTITITLTNNTGSDYFIDSFHFDYGRRNNSPDAFVVTYVSGGLGPAATQIDSRSGLAVNSVSGTYFNAPDYDYTLSSSLSDRTLANGESAVFTVVFSGPATASGMFDNIAFTGTLIPEPSAALLGGLGALLLLRRRR